MNKKEDSSLDWEIARRDLHARYSGREHWIIIFDPEGLRLVAEIIEQHYVDVDPRSVSCALSFCQDGFFGAIALPKREMLANKFKCILKKHGVSLTEREIVSRDVICAAPRELAPAATAFGRLLFGDLIGAPLPPEANIELVEMTRLDDRDSPDDPNYRSVMRQLMRDGAINAGQILNVDIAHDDWCAIYHSKPCDCDPDIINRETGEVLNRKERTGEID